MNTTGTLLIARQALMVARNVSNSSAKRAAVAEVNPGYKQIKKIQERFQVEDDTLIFLKGGIMDQLLYRLTFGLCVLAIGCNLKLYYDLAFPKKK